MEIWDFPDSSAMNLPAIQETQQTRLQPLGQEDALKWQSLTPASLPEKNPMGRGTWMATVRKVTESDTAH